MDRDRLKRIRNYQSQDWYAALFIRPLTILVMIVIADWKWLTPNLLTLISVAFKIAAAALILVDDTTYRVVAVVALHIGLLFDMLDGTMARYQRSFSSFGSYFDKASDAISWFLICAALGWVASERSGDGIYLVLATGSAYALIVRGYAKWTVRAEEERLRWFEAKEDPEGAIAKHTAPPKLSEPPERTRAEWIRWFFRMAPRFIVFEEMDLPFWIGLGLLLDRVEWVVWLLGVTQVAGMLAMVVWRGVEVRRIDGKLRRYRETETD